MVMEKRKAMALETRVVAKFYYVISCYNGNDSKSLLQFYEHLAKKVECLLFTITLDEDL